MSLARRATFLSAPFLLAVALAFSGCTCSDGKLVDSCACTSDAECLSGFPSSCDDFHGLTGDNTYCEVSTGRCFQDIFECDPSTGHDAECCPGQICSSLAQICTNKTIACEDDASCLVKGQVCRPIGTPAGDKGCTFETCGEGGTCAEGLSCFNGQCVGEPPCNGGCPDGQVCVPASNRCFKLEPGLMNGEESELGYPASCGQSCGAGYLLVFKDGTNVFDRCDRSTEARECGCEALPPITPADMARHSASAFAGDKIYVSAYDADHGDLVLHTFDTSGKRTRTEWIDGVPTSGAITGDPNGPRGGRATPGEDVGQYTSIAYDKTTKTTHIAYYAIANGAEKLGDLRYARRTGDTGPWTVYAVDELGDTGLYTSIALDAEGRPAISYFQFGGIGADEYKTALKVARAKSAAPAKGDWSLVNVQSGTRSSPPCFPGCDDDEVCTASPANPAGECRTKAANESDCTPACTPDQACVVNNVGAAACYTSLRAATLSTLPEGNGLFSSIAFVDGKPVVVWYDQNLGVLKGAVASSDSPSTGPSFGTADIKVLDDGSVTRGPAHDVGRFASIAVNPSSGQARLAVSYYDSTERQLRVLTANADLTNVTPPNLRVVDEGKGAPESDPVLFVGADTSIRFGADGAIVVAYQDATSGDLRIARKQESDNAFKLTQLRTEGACGFYASLTGEPGNLFVSHAIIKAASARRSGNRLEVVAVP